MSVVLRTVCPGLFHLHPPDGGEVYVVQTGDGLVLLDTGLAKHAAALQDAMQAAGLAPESLCLGFVSHFHCDHVGAMGRWSAQFDFPVVAHANAAGPMEAADRVITGSYLPYCGFDEPFDPCPVAHPVRGGETFPVGGAVFETIFAPGHTVGSLHVAGDGWLFVGDTIFPDGSIGWMDAHWGSNPDDYVQTLEALRPAAGTLLLPGHGAPFVLTDALLDRALEITRFYIPLGHGLGAPRAPSGLSG